MTSLALPAVARPHLRPEGAILAGTITIGALIAAAFARRLAMAGPSGLVIHHAFLAVHLATVIPAVPLGGWLLARPKGGRVHRSLGRLWAVMMMVTAAVSFGVQSSGHLSWIHLFSVLVLVTVPRAVLLAIRGDIAGHRRAILRIYAGLVIAGAFTFLPGRLLGQWLLG